MSYAVLAATGAGQIQVTAAYRYQETTEAKGIAVFGLTKNGD